MQQRNRGKDLLTLAEKSHYNKTMGDAHRTPEVKKWGDAPRTNNSSQIYIYILVSRPTKNAGKKGGTPLTSVIAHSIFFSSIMLSHVSVHHIEHINESSPSGSNSSLNRCFQALCHLTSIHSFHWKCSHMSILTQNSNATTWIISREALTEHLQERTGSRTWHQ